VSASIEAASVGDRVTFAEGRMPFTVQARDERFVICTRPFALQKTVLYSVVDLREGIRGPDNMVLCFGYETREACEARLRDLNRPDDPTEVSYRHRIPLRVAKVTPGSARASRREEG
jgi:hypothetical protein